METKTAFLSTSVGKKIVMAVSGVIVFGFVVIHILGNLQLFVGPQALNQYAAFLQDLGAIKWVARGVLAASAVVHMVSAYQLTLQNLRARPQGYVIKKYQETTYAARTMRIGGPMIAFFLVYHLLHFTTGDCHPMKAGFVPNEAGAINVYNNVVFGFQEPIAAVVYMVAMVLVGLHLYHGLWSMLQTMGINHRKWNHLRKAFAIVFSLFIAIAGMSLPVAVLSGIITPV